MHFALTLPALGQCCLSPILTFTSSSDDPKQTRQLLLRLVQSKLAQSLLVLLPTINNRLFGYPLRDMNSPLFRNVNNSSASLVSSAALLCWIFPSRCKVFDVKLFNASPTFSSSSCAECLPARFIFVGGDENEEEDTGSLKEGSK